MKKYILIDYYLGKPVKDWSETYSSKEEAYKGIIPYLKSKGKNEIHNNLICVKEISNMTLKDLIAIIIIGSMLAMSVFILNKINC